MPSKHSLLFEFPEMPELVTATKKGNKNLVDSLLRSGVNTEAHDPKCRKFNPFDMLSRTKVTEATPLLHSMMRNHKNSQYIMVMLLRHNAHYDSQVCLHELCYAGDLGTETYWTSNHYQIDSPQILNILLDVSKEKVAILFLAKAEDALKEDNMEQMRDSLNFSWKTNKNIFREYQEELTNDKPSLRNLSSQQKKTIKDMCATVIEQNQPPARNCNIL